MFAIVEFDDGVKMVPMAWLRDDRKHCMWPPFTNQLKINKAINNLDPVSSEWKCHKVNRIFATTDNYEKGMSKLRLCEKFSDIDSSDKDESKLKKLRQERAKKIRNSSSSSSDEGSISNVLSFPPAPTNLLDRSCDVSVQKVSISQGPSHELNDISGTSSGPQTSKENVKEFQQFVVRKLNMIVLKLDMIEERIQLLETKVKGG